MKEYIAPEMEKIDYEEETLDGNGLVYSREGIDDWINP